MRNAGWEFMGHGYSQGALHMAPDQGEVIRKSFDVLTRYSGKAPKGWLGPGLHGTFETPDILVKTGLKDVFDYPMDEHPVATRTGRGPMAAMPYTLELSDLPMGVVHSHESEVWLKRAKRHFDRLYAEGAKAPRVMSMSVHPCISGVPHRIGYFEAAYDCMRKQKGVWFATAEEIHECRRAQQA